MINHIATYTSGITYTSYFWDVIVITLILIAAYAQCNELLLSHIHWCNYVNVLLHLGVPQPVRRVNVTIVFPYANVTWEYDDSVNGVPALYFIGNVTQTDGLNTTMFQVPASVRSTLIPLNIFMSGQEYTASIAVRNLQGVSEIIGSEPFTGTCL